MLPETVFGKIGFGVVVIGSVYLLPFIIQIAAFFLHEGVRRVLNFVFLNFTNQNHPDAFAHVHVASERVRDGVSTVVGWWYMIFLLRFLSHPHESITPTTR